MKHVISVGFDIPGEVVNCVSFKSNDSLLDADVIVFAPNMEDYDTADPYQGKPRISDGDSACLQMDSEHWHKELCIALEGGKTVFVMMLEATDVYVFTGQKNYLGSGRSTRVTHIVIPFDVYSSIPVPGLVEQLQRKKGERIKTTKDIGILAPYWHQFSDATYYDIYLEKNIGVAALVTQTGDKMVGGIIRFEEWKGTVVLLPLPNFEYLVEQRMQQQAKQEKEQKQSSASDDEETLHAAAEESVGNQFVSALLEIDKVLYFKAEKTPTPTWANSKAYALAAEMGFEARIRELDAKITELQEQKIEAENGLDSAGNLRGLMFETGKPLESAIVEALRTLGFQADGFSDEESEFDAVFTDPSGIRLLGEAEGKNEKAINIDKLAQLERNIQEDFERRDDTTYAKGVLFGNAFRLLPPAERGEYFTQKCLSGARRSGIALVRTPDLFPVARFLKENPDSEFAALCRRAILETTGAIVSFPTVPETAIPQSA